MKVYLSGFLAYLLLFLLTGCASPNGYVNRYGDELNAPPSSISAVKENKNYPALSSEEKDLVETASASDDSKTSGDLNAGRKKEVQNQLDTALDLCDASQEYWAKGELEEAI